MLYVGGYKLQNQELTTYNLLGKVLLKSAHSVAYVKT